MEVLAGARPEADEDVIEMFLRDFRLIDLSRPIARAALALRRTRRVGLPDAIIWATAQHESAILVTRNTRDFSATEPGVRVPYQPRPVLLSASRGAPGPRGSSSMKTVLVTLLGVLALVAGLPAQQAASARFGFDDFSRVKRVAEPQFSPDGASIAVIVATPNLDLNRHVASLHRVDTASGRMQMLVDGAAHVSVSFPRWAPNGQQIAFLATVPTGSEPRPQIFVVPSQGGDPKQITKAPMGVQQIAWSPDSRTIGFATADEPEKKPGYQRFNDSFDVQPNFHLFMTAPVPPTHVWMVPAAGGESKRLTSGTWTLPVSRPPGAPSSVITWTPDGSAIVFSRSGGGAGGLQAVNIADGVIKPIGVSGSHPQFSPAGDQIAYLGGNSASVAPVGGRGRQLTQALDRRIARVLWMPDGKSVIVGGNDSERVSLWQQPLEGAATKLDTGGISPNSSFFVDMAVSRTGAIAFAGSSPSRPAELYYMASPSAPIRRLTDVNAAAAAMPLGKVEMIKHTFEKFEQNGVLVYPVDFDPSKKYPLVLVIHGGPAAASLLTFDPRAQMMAARGWLVFSPNYRGSDNLGGAFQRAISGDAGAGPGRDVMAGIETIKQRGIVDDTRMAVSGWSYGGYMTTWMLGNYPTVWRAGVAGAAVTDRIDQQNFSDGAGRGSAWINAEQMERERAQSPITYAGKIKAPTLILANTGDYRVPITQSYKLFHALRAAGVTARFVAYPINAHNASDPVRQRDVQERWIAWIERYFNEPPSPGGGR
jgi:dipeptidyl aminopeptidase/acylaminoacyl peptidase